MNITYSPTLIFTAIWAFSASVYTFFFNNPSLEVLFYITTFILCMFTGEMLGKFKIFRLALPSIPSNSIIKIFSILLSTLILFYIVYMYNFYKSYNSLEEALLRIRIASLQGNYVIENYRIFLNIIQISVGLNMIGLIQSVYKNRSFSNHVFFINCILTASFASLLDGSRSFFLMSIFWLLITLFLTNIIKLRTIIVLSIIIISFFSMTFAIFRPIDNSFYNGLIYSALYLSGGIGSIEYVLSDYVFTNWQTLELILEKLFFLEPNDTPLAFYNLQNEFSYINNQYKTNVYTALGVYYNYFGNGMFAFAAILGYFGGQLSVLSSKNAITLCFYSLFICSLGLSVFHDYFLSHTYYSIKLLFALSIINMFDFFNLKVSFK